MTEEKLSGEIQSVIYSNEDTGYSVVRVACEDHSLVTAVGVIPFAAPGEGLEASGHWTEHPSHGSQFVVNRAERSAPSTSGAILTYLASGIIQGVGRATARLIVERFGEETLDILAARPDRLTEIRGITAKRAQTIAHVYAQKTGQRRLMELLAAFGLPPGFALDLCKRYGAAAEKVLREDPYLLLEDPFAADFDHTDRLAASLGIADDDPRRCRAGVLHELNFNLNEGHSFLPGDKLVAATMGLLGLPEEHIRPALTQLLDQDILVRDDNDAFYLRRLYRAEADVAAFVLARDGQEHSVPRDILSVLDRLEEETAMTYAEAQREAILMAARSGLMILTGGPGTGKTTAVRGMLRLFDWLGLRALLCAPTGRAAKRLSELTGREASTIHRLLEFGYDPVHSTLRFLRDRDRPLDCDVVILDECSMVDILLMKSLTDAIPRGVRLVLVGDPDQLPAVGPGNVLEDLLRGKRTASVQLHEIFRQAAQSRIVTHAHTINRGELPGLQNDKKGDFFFMQRNDYPTAVDTIIELCRDRLPKGLGLDAGQIQVLSPTRKGPCGTVSLNKALQQALNPPASHKLEKRFGEYVYREGDRVMQIRNNYDIAWRSAKGTDTGMGIFNGEIGVIREIDPTAYRLTVQFDNRIAEYAFSELSELEPAFAMTVHKAQGSEYGAVVLAVMPGAEPLMTRRVLYTAIARARDWLILVGQEETLRRMVQNARRTHRYSGLAARLTVNS